MVGSRSRSRSSPRREIIAAIPSNASARSFGDSSTRGAQLRSWMEGWRITCPVCDAALEEFRLLMRLLQAEPNDGSLARVDGRARAGEQILARASLGHRGNSAQVILMRRLLSPQVTRTRTSRGTDRRLLDLVVPGSTHLFHRLPPEIWSRSTRVLRSVCASRCLPELQPCRAIHSTGSTGWSALLRRSIKTNSGSAFRRSLRRELQSARRARTDSRFCRKFWNAPYRNSSIKRQKMHERALFHYFSAT